MSDPVKYSWTQPACDDCWSFIYPGRQPLRFKDPDPETCCRCGVSTTSGIYIPVDPATVEHPTPTKD